MAVSTTSQEHKRIVNRLRRANGQLTALIAAVDGGADCRAVITQLSAVTSALDRAGFAIISSTMRDCLANPNQEGAPTPEELEKLFMTLA